MSDFFSELFAFKFKWLHNLFSNSHKPFLQAAIDITNIVKTGLNSGIVDFITGIIPGTIDDSIAAVLKKEVPMILADEMLLQSAGTPTTKADAEDLAKKLIDNFGTLSSVKKEELYTAVAARIYIFLQDHSNGEKVTFGQAATLVEGFYEEWLNSKA